MLSNYHPTIREPRLGVMLHYDGSAADLPGLKWLLKDPACKVSYNDVIDDKGAYHQVAPEDARAWHAGTCRTSDPRLPYTDANSAFYGVAVLCDGDDLTTGAQLLGVAERAAYYFRKHGWPATETWRIVGHKSEAWPRDPSATPPRYRKVDPDGERKDGLPVLDVQVVRKLVAYVLAAA